MNRKGIVFTRPRDTISFFVGVILAVFGVLPLLDKFGVMKVPGFLTSLPVQIIVWIAAVGGLYVVIDGFIEPPAHSLHWFLIAAGIVLFVIGLLPLLVSFGVIKFTLIPLTLLWVYQIVITVEGVLLMIGGLTEH